MFVNRIFHPKDSPYQQREHTTTKTLSLGVTFIQQHCSLQDCIMFSVCFSVLSHNLGKLFGTTDDLKLVLFSAALDWLVALAKSIPVHSLILSSHLFCQPLFLFLFTLPCKIVFAKPEYLETWPNHINF